MARHSYTSSIITTTPTTTTPTTTTITSTTTTTAIPSQAEEEGGGEGGGEGEGEKDMYYLPYDHEYWNEDVKDFDEDFSLPGKSSPSGLLNSTTTTLVSGHSEGEGGEDHEMELVRGLAPLIALLVLALVLTLLGNALVCLVYRTRFRRNSVNLLVVFLAGLEMCLVSVAVPMEVAVAALPLAFHSGAACKAVRYVETAFVCCVLLVLTVVAVDRYLKMTRPTNFLSPRWVKGLCVGAVLVALALALPSVFVFGARDVPGLEDAMTCDVEQMAKSSPFRIVYVVLLLGTFTVAVVMKTVLYILMFVHICRRKSAARGSEKVSPTRREYPRKHRFVTEDSTSSCGGGEETRRLPTTSSSGSSGLGMAASVRSGRTSPGVDPARVPLKSGVKESARIGQGASTTVDVQSNRMTWIFFLASVMTLLTLLPFLVLRALLVLTPLLDHLHPLPLHLVYQLSLRLYLLHAPLLPLLYLCCNHNLRREARHLLQSLCLCCQRKRQRPPTTANGSAPEGGHR